MQCTERKISFHDKKAFYIECLCLLSNVSIKKERCRQKSIPLACWYNPQIDNAIQLSNNIIFAVITLLNKDGGKLTFCQQMVFQDSGKVNNMLSYNVEYKHEIEHKQLTPIVSLIRKRTKRN